MKQSTSFAQVATNLLNVLQAYTKGIRFLLVLFLTLTASTAWGATTANYTCSGTSGTIVSSKITFNTTSATWNSPQCRIAANGSITFTLTGVKVTKIAMGFSSSSYVGSWTSSGGGSFSTNSTTVTWTGSANPGTLTFTTSSAARLKTISVTYETATTTYSVTYDLNGGIGTKPTQAAVAAGGTFKLAASSGFSKAGYSFAGWNDGTNTYNAGDTYTMPAKEVTLKALWTALLQYTVTWSVAGKTTTEEVYSGDKVTKAPIIDENNLPCDGADKFVGWTTDEYQGDSEPNPLYKTAAEIPAITDDITFYAVFADYAD